MYHSIMFMNLSLWAKEMKAKTNKWDLTKFIKLLHRKGNKK